MNDYRKLVFAINCVTLIAVPCGLISAILITTGHEQVLLGIASAGGLVLFIFLLGLLADL